MAAAIDLWPFCPAPPALQKNRQALQEAGEGEAGAKGGGGKDGRRGATGLPVARAGAWRRPDFEVRPLPAAGGEAGAAAAAAGSGPAGGAAR
jgi:hypothetical protein